MAEIKVFAPLEGEVEIEKAEITYFIKSSKAYLHIVW